MTVSQKVQIVTFDYGPLLSDVTLRNLLTDALITGGTADTCNELAADAAVYVADFVNANEAALIPAGNYRLRAVVNGAPLNRYVTLAGTDGEVVQSSTVPPDASLTAKVDAIGVASAGGAIEATGRVAQGGKVTAYIGDDFRDRSDTALPVPVSDPAGGLYTKLTALGTDKLRFGVTAPGKAAGLITGTVASITQSGSGASQKCILNVEITNCGAGLPPGDQYFWQIEQEQTHSAETDDFVEIEGRFVLKQRAV